MNYIRYIYLTFVLIYFSGCAGVGVFYHFDPAAKLRDAIYLDEKANRPLIAERLILEAIDIYQERNDANGLGYSYFLYANFLRSNSIVSWEKHYRQNGFLTKEITYENRIQKSSDYAVKAIEYYRQTEKLYTEANQFDALANTYYFMGWSYWLVKDKGNSCKYFDLSLEANAENLRRVPNAKVSPPPGYTSYADFLKPVKKYAGCEEINK